MEINICHQILANCDKASESMALKIIHSGVVAVSSRMNTHVSCSVHPHWNCLCHWCGCCSLAQTVLETGKVWSSVGGRGFPNLRCKRASLWAHRAPQAATSSVLPQAHQGAFELRTAVGQSPAPGTNHCSASLWGWGGAARATRCISQGRAGRSSATHRLQQEQPARAQGSVIARGQSLAPPSRGCNDS